jgi:phosphohistidine phosphatase
MPKSEKPLKYSGNIGITPELVYDQSPMLLFPILQTLPPEAVVMCVGHEPHLGQTAALMLFGDHSPSLSFKKAGSALIVFHTNATLGQGILEWWIPPAQLRALRKG